VGKCSRSTLPLPQKGRSSHALCTGILRHDHHSAMAWQGGNAKKMTMGVISLTEDALRRPVVSPPAPRYSAVLPCRTTYYRVELRVQQILHVLMARQLLDFSSVALGSASPWWRASLLFTAWGWLRTCHLGIRRLATLTLQVGLE